MTSDQLRKAYLSFFESKGHKIIPSSSLIPQGDPTLLLTSAGMVQFKPYFLGEATPPSPRLTSCQKCFRATDIESVGDATHLTFFEMLGNFSIGDYFKPEAISWAWEFVTRHLKLPPERLRITVFLDDDEAFRIWRQVGVPEARILRLGEKDNFWGPAGDSGPCGPCSEIHYDFGEEVGCRQAECAPGCGCGRFSEIWNLVFTQYNQDKDGRRTPLPRPNIDTGMGLERTSAILQGKTSVYETDLFAPLLECISKLSGKRYGADEVTDNAMRVVVEHSRGIAFLIADGVMPSNEGRGYVLRRLLRRAALFGRRLGLEKPFLAETAGTTINQMKHIYPELEHREDFILKVIKQEEARFGETLDEGLRTLEGVLIPLKQDFQKRIDQLGEHIEWDRIENINPSVPLSTVALLVVIPVDGANQDLSSMATSQSVIPGSVMLHTTVPWHEALDNLVTEVNNLSQSPGLTRKDLRELVERRLKEIREMGITISGQEAFRLYDTYGFPVELTREIADSRGFSIDLNGFEQEMEKQRERARASHKFELAEKGDLANKLSIKETTFTGYSSLTHKTTLLNILVDNDTVDTIKEEQEARLILQETPFYGEMGGQVGDTGEIRSTTGHFEVTNTLHLTPGIIIHQGRVTKGSFNTGAEVEAEVNETRRLDIARNHTATHLLQSALRQVLGEHIQQRGSLVAPDQLRFDFSHLTAMTKEEIQKVNNIVNQRIRQNLKVSAKEMPYNKAIKAGATALFAEKYGDTVRVLTIGRPPISAELCGGTHINTTGEIGFSHIIAESSIGAGLRRIEAVTGRGAEEFVGRRLSNLTNMASRLASEEENIPDKVASLITELDQEHKRVQTLERELAKRDAEAIEGKVHQFGSIKVLAERVNPTNIDNLRDMSDVLRNKLGNAVVVLGTVWENRPVFVANTTLAGYDAGEIVRVAAAVTGGSGGGKKTLAQGGGKDISKIDDALKEVEKYIAARIGGPL